ncbi:MAG: hypothetical protein ACM3S1_12065 [Hyphomicrobiales bacterium]
MTVRWTRAAMLVAAVLMLLGGLGAVLAGGGGSAEAQIEHEGNVIEILPGDLGFNPEHCQLNRNGSIVQFYNTDNVPRRIIQPSISVDPEATPELDTGYIEPGTYSGKWQVQGYEIINYEDADNPSLKGEIVAPLYPAPDICQPLPPTPTPTNAPSVTATPTESPTATPSPTPQRSPRCIGAAGCAVAPYIARDEDN